MGKLRVLSGSEICQILEQNGFTVERQRGSHRVLQKRVGETTVTVPVPLHDSVRKGTLMSIVRQSGLPKSLFESSSGSMPTTWFFDGSGTNSQQRVMVLSGVGGSDTAVDRLGNLWCSALRETGIPIWHSSAYFRRRPGAPPNQLPTPLVNVIGQLNTMEINCVSYAVEKASVEHLRAQFPDLIPPLPELLLRLCFKGVGVSKDDDRRKDSLRILFDRNEPFIRHLKSSWQEGRAFLKREKEAGWASQIREIEPASSQEHPVLQVADFLSWAIRSRYEYGDKMQDVRVIQMMFPFVGKLWGGFLDAARVRSLYIEKRPLELSHNYSFV